MVGGGMRGSAGFKGALGKNFLTLTQPWQRRIGASRKISFVLDLIFSFFLERREVFRDD